MPYIEERSFFTVETRLDPLEASADMNQEDVMTTDGIHLSFPTGVLVIAFVAIISPLFLLFGIANLVEPQVAAAYLGLNTVVCLGMIGFAFVLLPVAFGIIRGTFMKH